MYNMADLSQFRGCVVVQPKPREHVVNIVDGQFRPGKQPSITCCLHVAWSINKTYNTLLYLLIPILGPGLNFCKLTVISESLQ